MASAADLAPPGKTKSHRDLLSTCLKDPRGDLARVLAGQSKRAAPFGTSFQQPTPQIPLPLEYHTPISPDCTLSSKSLICRETPIPVSLDD